MVEKHFNISIASVRSRGGSLVSNILKELIKHSLSNGRKVMFYDYLWNVSAILECLILFGQGLLIDVADYLVFKPHQLFIIWYKIKKRVVFETEQKVPFPFFNGCRKRRLKD
jgi:hypothetical protein